VAICCLAFVVAPAFAAKPAPATVTTSPAVANPYSTTAACDMGILPPPQVAFGYILPPGDEYYTLIDPRTCSDDCGHPGGGVQSRLITNAHVLHFYTEPCQIPATISIAPAFETSPGCFTPNPFAPDLCPAVNTMYSDEGGPLATCVDQVRPVVAGCCITEPAFLKIVYNQGTCGGGRPAFCGPDGQNCSPCRQYNYYPGASFPGDDVCVVLSPQGIGGVDMWVESECCNPTPTLPGSWGSLKTLYR
jgi:hypothetical protein